ncbi:glycoside hydrolase family 31 [Pleomorphomonas diazotrophica]|uniref:Glycoside hydrolase family 31 n=2 Tax=Pleomorphomonas diazotrophica TaxID=1166257 RepID=A0A1I4RYG7_9HYPH|nr:glycoside hydrolase family 31 [Pleomorphomonas diazotrophica]SFM57054.1 alpha-D-xyloside xylohydrolase [Pleomorphomonas diazotrophica]
MTKNALSHTGMTPDFVKTYPGGSLCISAVSDRAFRVRFSPTGPENMPESQILTGDLPPVIPLVRSRDGVTRLELPHVVCELTNASGRLRFLDGDGTLLLAEAERSLIPGLLDDEPIHIAEQAFASPPNERLYGTGCFQDGALDLRGLPRRLTQVNTQISLPFMLSSRGYGLIWHHLGRSELNPPPHRVALAKRAVGKARTATVTTSSGGADVERRTAIFEGEIEITTGGRQAMLLDIGRKMGSRYRVEIDGRTLADHDNFWLPPTTSFFADLTPGRHTVHVEANDTDEPVLHYGPVTDRTVWRSPVTDAIDYVVIAGPSASEVMGGYRQLLGPTPMLPIWAFGYVHCRERFHSSVEIIDTLDEFRRRDLPLDVIVQDWQYWGSHGWNAMRFDEAQYPDPKRLIDEVHRRDARFMLSVWARIDPSSELGKEFARRGYFIEGTDWVDFFNPDAAAFYAQQQEERLRRFGIDAWWQDATEPENDDLAGRMTAAGRGEHVQLAYPLEVTRAVSDSWRAALPDTRALILTRSAFLGQHQYPAFTWSGDVGNDWATLANQIAAGLNMAAAGYAYWTVDAGGFFRPGPGQYDDPAYRERFLRWFQYATFLPMQRVHGFETDTEFWRYGEKVEAVSRAYLELRYRLLPYIYSTAAETAETGVPMMRPLVFDFAADPRALDEVHSYMFGRTLHVAPVLAEGAESWPVYLPGAEGGWFDVWSGDHRVGGRTHDVPSPLDRIPLHARAGSILPVGPVIQSTAGMTRETLTLYVFPGHDGALELYEDDGLSLGHERGEWARIPVRWNDREGTLQIGACQGSYPGMPRVRHLTICRVRPGVSPMTSTTGVVVEYRGAPITVSLE